MNPFVIDRGDSEELLQRIGSLRRLIEVMVGERLSAERRSSLDHAPGGLLRRGQGTHRLQGFLPVPPKRRRRRHRPPAAALRHRQPAASPLRRGRRPADPRGPGSPSSTCTFWSRSSDPPPRWSAPRRCGPPPPRTPVPACWWWTRCGASCSTRRARPSWSAWRSAPANTGWGCSSSPRTCRTCSARTPPRAITGHSGRALLQNAAFKLLLQQDAAAISTVGEAFDLPVELQRWLLSCPRGDGLLLARGNRFPVRIEATPEETEVIEWRPGPRH